MSATSLEVLGTVRPDGTLELDQKLTVPPGRVKVRVESVETPAQPTETLVEFVDRSRRELEAAGHHFMNSGSKLKTTGSTSSGKPVGNGPNARVLDAASTAPCASRSNEKLPDRLMNVRSDTEPSR